MEGMMTPLKCEFFYGEDAEELRSIYVAEVLLDEGDDKSDKNAEFYSHAETCIFCSEELNKQIKATEKNKHIKI